MDPAEELADLRRRIGELIKSYKFAGNVEDELGRVADELQEILDGKEVSE